MDGLRVMSGEDLGTVKAAVTRIETRLDGLGERLDKLERFADKAEGALTLTKFVVSLLGLSGIGTLLVLLARSA